MTNIWIINQYGSIPTTGVGGRHRHLSRELAKMGHEVALISASWTHLTRHDKVSDEVPPVQRFEGFQFVRIPVFKYKHSHDKMRVLNWFVFSYRLRYIEKRLSVTPDVIICSSPSLIAYLGAYRLAKKFNARLIFEVRDIWPLTFMQLGGFSPRHPFIRFMQWVEDFAYKKSDIVVSNLKGAFQHMVQRGMIESKFNWIPNGVSLEELERSDPAPVKMIKAIEAQPFSVAYTGTVGAANSLETLVRAAHILRDKEHIHFNIVGRGQRVPALTLMIQELGLKNVHLWHEVEKNQVQSVLSAVDVCYIGLTKDPLFRYGVSPNKLFDYFYASKPIIYAIDSGDYKPVFDAGAGVEVEPESPDRVAEAILHLSKLSSEQRFEMGKNGRREVMAKYNYEALARSFVGIINE